MESVRISAKIRISRYRLLHKWSCCCEELSVENHGCDYFLILLSGCAEKVAFDEASAMVPVGFWHGFWHGMIALVAWIISLFDKEVTIYAIYNNGVLYNLGFIMGVGAFSISYKSCKHARGS